MYKNQRSRATVGMWFGGDANYWEILSSILAKAQRNKSLAKTRKNIARTEYSSPSFVGFFVPQKSGLAFTLFFGPVFHSPLLILHSPLRYHRYRCYHHIFLFIGSKTKICIFLYK
jgi:hypothetical protein